MKVLHIVPAAFNYFDNIRSEAFAILEEENNLGIDSDVITLEFGSTVKKEQAEVKRVSPGSQFMGQQSVIENTKSWDYYDIINLHCPFLGAASHIISWTKDQPSKRLVITYHNDFKTPDFFSLIIKFYNLYYLPKLFSLAKAVCFFANRRSDSMSGIKMLKNDEKAFVLGQTSDELDIHNIDVASDLILVYNNIMLINN